MKPVRIAPGNPLSGHRHKGKRSSFRHESRSQRSFSLYRACARRRVSERNRAKRGTWRGDRHVSFSLAREKEMWGATVPLLFQEEQNPPRCRAQPIPLLPRRPPPPRGKTAYFFFFGQSTETPAQRRYSPKALRSSCVSTKAAATAPATASATPGRIALRMASFLRYPFFL